MAKLYDSPGLYASRICVLHTSAVCVICLHSIPLGFVVWGRRGLRIMRGKKRNWQSPAPSRLPTTCWWADPRVGCGGGRAGVRQSASWHQRRQWKEMGFLLLDYKWLRSILFHNITSAVRQEVSGTQDKDSAETENYECFLEASLMALTLAGKSLKGMCGSLEACSAHVWA